MAVCRCINKVPVAAFVRDDYYFGHVTNAMACSFQLAHAEECTVRTDIGQPEINFPFIQSTHTHTNSIAQIYH